MFRFQSRQQQRLDDGGQINRLAPITFTFDGKKFIGFEGDTLASALLANGVRLVGRSFKYHRPRGIYSAGIEEPNALVALRSGAAMNLTLARQPLNYSPASRLRAKTDGQTYYWIIYKLIICSRLSSQRVFITKLLWVYQDGTFMNILSVKPLEWGMVQNLKIPTNTIRNMCIATF